jgi:hypothetical protein
MGAWRYWRWQPQQLLLRQPACWRAAAATSTTVCCVVYGLLHVSCLAAVSTDGSCPFSGPKQHSRPMPAVAPVVASVTVAQKQHTHTYTWEQLQHPTNTAAAHPSCRQQTGDHHCEGPPTTGRGSRGVNATAVSSRAGRGPARHGGGTTPLLSANWFGGHAQWNKEASHEPPPTTTQPWHSKGALGMGAGLRSAPPHAPTAAPGSTGSLLG